MVCQTLHHLGAEQLLTLTQKLNSVALHARVGVHGELLQQLAGRVQHAEARPHRQTVGVVLLVGHLVSDACRPVGHVLQARMPAKVAAHKQQRVGQWVGVRAQAADGLQTAAARVHHQVPVWRSTVATHENGRHFVANRVVEAPRVLLRLSVKEERHALWRPTFSSCSALLLLQYGGHRAEGAHVRIHLRQHPLQIGHDVGATGTVPEPAETLFVRRSRVDDVELGVFARSTGTLRMEGAEVMVHLSVNPVAVRAAT